MSGGKQAHWGLLTPFAGPSGGGVAEAVVLQAKILQSLGHRVTVFALEEPDGQRDPRLAEMDVKTVRGIGPGRLGYSRGLIQAILHAGVDGLHLHGIWQHPTRVALDWRRKTDRPLIISFHGMVEPWILSRGKLQKAVARKLYLDRACQSATLLHALTDDEAGDIQRFCGRGAAVVPNPAPRPVTGPPPERTRTVVYLGRIHPKKNLAALFDAWSALAKGGENGGWRLIVAGWGEDGHVAQMRAQLEQASGDIDFIGPVFGEAKDRLLSEARFVALASHSEGLPMVILESWANATPTIMSRECHLSQGFEAGASFDCGTDVTAIANALKRAFELPEAQWQEMSSAARHLAQGEFSADAVAEKWRAVYDGAQSV